MTMLMSMPTGSHTVLELLKEGYRATIIDNFDNAFEACYERMKKLAGDKADKMTLIKACSRWAVSRSCLHVCYHCGTPGTLAADIPMCMQGDLRNFDDIDKALGTDK